MPLTPHRLPTLALLLAFVPFIGPASAESFLLKGGGRVEGELLNPQRALADPYSIRTGEGMTLSLARDQVSKVVLKRDVEKEYERLAPRVPDSVEGHWKMAEWCREAGLKTSREHHLREVLNRDAEHEASRLALGYQRFEGKWQRVEEYMAAQGYVRHEGHWRTRQEIELLAKSSDSESAAIEWRKTIRIWRSWLGPGKKRDAEAIANFRALRDPAAVPALLEVLLDRKTASRELRLEVIETLSQMKGNPAEGTFAQLVIHDDDASIRGSCLDKLERQCSKLTVRRFEGMLRDDNNAVINRAANALARVKDPASTTSLIDALVTTHEQVVVPGSSGGGGMGPISSTFSNDGSTGASNPGGFNFGSPKAQKVKVDRRNESVLSALAAIHPGVNFAYDESAWKRWYESTHEPERVNLRRSQ